MNVFKINLSLPQTFQSLIKSVTSTPAEPTKLSKVIEESQKNHIIEIKNASKHEKPSLWQQFKTKAQNLSDSTSAFVNRHPHAVKATLTAVAVAIVTGAFFALSKSAPARLPRDLLGENLGGKPDTGDGLCSAQDCNPAEPDPKPTIVFSKPEAAKLPQYGSKKFNFLLAKAKSSQSVPSDVQYVTPLASNKQEAYSFLSGKIVDLKNRLLEIKKEGMQLLKLSPENIVNFVWNYHQPIMMVMSVALILLSRKKISLLPKLEPALQRPQVMSPLLQFPSDSKFFLNINGSQYLMDPIRRAFTVGGTECLLSQEQWNNFFLNHSNFSSVANRTK